MLRTRTCNVSRPLFAPWEEEAFCVLETELERFQMKRKGSRCGPMIEHQVPIGSCDVDCA
jgi:hypothetical protein